MAITNNVKMTYQQIEDACVQLVTTNRGPFSLMDDSGFIILINPLLKSLDANDIYFKTMNRCKIKQIITDRGPSLRNDT